MVMQFQTTRVLATLLATLMLATPARGWFGPSAKAPYVIVDPAAAKAGSLIPGWTWVDARIHIDPENRPTRDGYWFGDAVMEPRPFTYIQAEFLRQVDAHEDREVLLERLQGKTLRLLEFEAGVGLWLRLSDRQQSKWETVRVRAVIEMDGRRYEATDTHPFNNSETPSPVSVPMQGLVQSLVIQVHLF